MDKQIIVDAHNSMRQMIAMGNVKESMTLNNMMNKRNETINSLLFYPHFHQPMKNRKTEHVTY